MSASHGAARGSEEEGYCAIWNNFFTEVCLKNPDMRSSEVMDILFKFFKNKENIEDYLRKELKVEPDIYSQLIGNNFINSLFQNRYFYGIHDVIRKGIHQ